MALRCSCAPCISSLAAFPKWHISTMTVIKAATKDSNHTDRLVFGPASLYFFKSSHIQGYSWALATWYSNTQTSSLGTSAVISESLRNEFDDIYLVLGETFAHRTICPFNRVVISALLQFLQQLPIDNKSDAGMLERRTAEPDCSAVIAFRSLCQYIISSVNEIPIARSA